MLLGGMNQNTQGGLIAWPHTCFRQDGWVAGEKSWTNTPCPYTLDVAEMVGVLDLSLLRCVTQIPLRLGGGHITALCPMECGRK